ncbi:MAG: hypothetical protein RR543_04720 [Erysipelotrichales bacterium]
MKIFIDVDNTILEHSGFYSIETESRIHSTIGRFPNENQKAIEIMYDSAICRNPDIIRKMMDLDYVYILTKYPVYEYEIHKQRRVAEVLGYTHDELMNLKDPEGHNKYIYLDVNASKVNTVKDIFKIDSLSDCILIDDYSSNLIEWENNDGLSIKYYNEYNSSTHPLKGISISNFKFFSPLVNNNEISQLLVACNDSYRLNSFIKILDCRSDFEEIDILKIVYKDMLQKMDLEKININTKYNLLDFVIEYFHFYNNVNGTYWTQKFVEQIKEPDKMSLICTTFDINLNNLKITDHVSYDDLTLKIIDDTNKKATNIYDIYLTLDKNVFLDDVDNSLEGLVNTLTYLLKIDK